MSGLPGESLPTWVDRYAWLLASALLLLAAAMAVSGALFVYALMKAWAS